MSHTVEGTYRLKELEHQHADQGQLEDFARSEALATDQEHLASTYWLRPSTIGAIFSIGMATTASYFAFSPAAAIITVINADIGPSENSSLFSIIWSTCAAVSILLFGRTSDKFGRRWYLIGASLMGLVGGIIACTAKDMNTLIGANVLLGISGGVHSCYGILCGEICPNRYKFLGVAICVFPAIIPTGFGAYLAQSLVHHANWRWVYYIYLMLMAPTAVLQFFFYHPPSFAQLHGGTRSKMEEFKRIDFVGAFLFIAGLFLFLLGVSWGGEPAPWKSAKILCLLLIGFVILVAFVLWEIYGNVANPLVPMHYFKDVRGFVMLTIIGSVAGTLYISLSILWPSQVAAIYSSGNSWESNAWLSTTIAFGVQSGIYIMGGLFHIIKHVRWQLLVLMAISVAFCGGLASCNSSNKSQSAAFSFLAAFPAGALELIPGLLVQMDSDDADLGSVFCVIFTFRTAVGSIFTAVFVAILNNKVPIELESHVVPAVTAAGFPSSSLPDLFSAISVGTAEAIGAVPNMTPAVAAVLTPAISDSYAAAYAFVYYAAVAVGGVGLIAVLCLRPFDHEFTTHVPRKIYSGGHISETDVDVAEKTEPTPSHTEAGEITPTQAEHGEITEEIVDKEKTVN